MLYAAVSSYKEILDSYIAKLEGSGDLESQEHWPSHSTDDVDEMDEPVSPPLLHADIINSAVKVKQRMVRREQELVMREQKIRSWHRCLSHTMEQQSISSEDDSPDSWSHISSPVCDMETSLFSSYLSASPYYHKHPEQDRRRHKTPFSLRHCLTAAVIVIISASALLTTVSLSLYYSGHFSHGKQYTAGKNMEIINYTMDYTSIEMAETTTASINYTQPSSPMMNGTKTDVKLVIPDNITNGNSSVGNATTPAADVKENQVSSDEPPETVYNRTENITNSININHTAAIISEDPEIIQPTKIQQTNQQMTQQTMQQTTQQTIQQTIQQTKLPTSWPTTEQLIQETTTHADYYELETNDNTTEDPANITDSVTSAAHQQTTVYELNNEV